jgi:aminoglycoside 3-N-acetyltransferase
LLHSSLKSIGYVEGGAQTVIEAILDVISSSGTLVVPTYSMRSSMSETL